jgi:hypothetical protein
VPGDAGGNAHSYAFCGNAAKQASVRADALSFANMSFSGDYRPGENHDVILSMQRGFRVTHRDSEIG